MAKNLSEILNKTLKDTITKGFDEYEDPEKGIRIKAIDPEKLYRLQKKVERDEEEASSTKPFGIFADTKFKDIY